MAKEDGLRRANAIKSSSSPSEVEDSPIRIIFCLKKKVSMEEFEKVEDCFILDFDPFESISLSNKLSKDDDDAQDLSVIGERGQDDDDAQDLSVIGERGQDDDDAQDLSVIGERGQVACRDYPHSRHLCAKFPFNKTPHKDYCERCYCYVCDSIAPCKSWEKPEGRHCDATEHDESWKNLRRISQHLR